MNVGAGSRYLPAAIRAGAVATMAGFAVLAPIRMAEGAPKTRLAIVPAAVTGAARVAAAAGPEVAPDPGPVVDSPFPLSHLGVRWLGSEDAAVDIRLAGPDGVWGPWRAMPASHDLEDGDGGPVLSDLIRGHDATHAQVRATGDARNVEIVAIDTLHGPRPRRLATATPASAAEADKPPSDGGEDRGPDAATPP
ncbi:MAG: hypothetical protein LC792_10300, partial [Actinobacteria bacterium]|nr:hypothetical protein [Actinomycetota bacterium]